MSVQTLPKPSNVFPSLLDLYPQGHRDIYDQGIKADSQSRDSDQDVEFDHLPPFPNDIPIAPLLRIELAKLLKGDQNELDRFWTACCELGFFYLDLRGSKSFLARGTPSVGEKNALANNTWGPGIDGRQTASVQDKTGAFDVDVDGDQLLDEADRMFKAGEKLFDLPLAEKRKYDYAPTGTYFGYKGAGESVTDAKGTPDRSEFYMMSKDDILGVSDPRPHPTLVGEHQPLLASYMRHSHAIVTLILRLLNARLGLPLEKLTSLHRLDVASGDQARWIRSKPHPVDQQNVALGAHTDYGSVTVLFNQLGGLQVLPPGDDKQWCYVKPLKGHAIVNLGDALVKFSAGILRSNIHRIMNPPGEQAAATRMSLVYFSRPNDDVILKALDGSSMIDERKKDAEEDPLDGLTSKEWIIRRAYGRRKGGDYKNSHGTDGSRLQ